jgi:hypothetical protein
MEKIMDKLKSLEIKKLIKELDYIETDFEWRSEVVNEADTSFLTELNNFLDKNPELKELYDSKITEKLENSIKSKIKESEESQEKEKQKIPDSSEEQSDRTISENSEEEIENKINISPKVKKLYRDIVKKTHPDIINDKEMNDFYIKATEYHENNDKIGLYKICDELNIKFELDEEDSFFIEKKIQEYKKRISFLESTFTWKWFNTEDEGEKNNILLTFIKLKIKN